MDRYVQEGEFQIYMLNVKEIFKYNEDFKT